MHARNLFWLLPLLLALSSPLWKPATEAFLTPRGDFSTERMQEPQHMPSGQTFSMDEVRVIVANNGKTVWEIQAAHVWSVGEGGDVAMSDVLARHVGAGKDPVIITSKKGRYSRTLGHLVLSEQVMLENPQKKQRLFSEELHYKNNSEMMISPGKVRIETPDTRVDAGNMEYNLRTGRYDFKKRVQLNL